MHIYIPQLAMQSICFSYYLHLLKWVENAVVSIGRPREQQGRSSSFQSWNGIHNNFIGGKYVLSNSVKYRIGGAEGTKGIRQVCVYERCIIKKSYTCNQRQMTWGLLTCTSIILSTREFTAQYEN